MASYRILPVKPVREAGRLGQPFVGANRTITQRVGGASVAVGATLVTSKEMQSLFKLARSRMVQGAIRAANITNEQSVHMIMHNVWREYRKARRSGSGRDSRRSERLLEEYINPESATNFAAGTPRVAEVRLGGVGFGIDYTRMDRWVTNKGFPYWRSVEYGYGAFVATGLFTSNRDWPRGRRKGTYSVPSDTRRGMDPRFPQFSRGAEVYISGFKGYGFIDKGIRDGMDDLRYGGFGRNYGDRLLLQLPPELVAAAQRMQDEGLGLNVGANRLVDRRARRFISAIP